MEVMGLHCVKLLHRDEYSAGNLLESRSNGSFALVSGFSLKGLHLLESHSRVPVLSAALLCPVVKASQS